MREEIISNGELHSERHKRSSVKWESMCASDSRSVLKTQSTASTNIEYFNMISNRILNMFLALLFIILGLPLFALIALLVFITGGRPIIYGSIRLGLNKKLFIMYKFRTLQNGSDRLIGDQLLSHNHRLSTPIGMFLRDTRLDELPQLFNILIGHMNFIGPRPERPKIYENLCAEIPDYGRRFSVKPGLIGYSQAFTPHNTPKKIRALFDNQMLKNKSHFFEDIFLIYYTSLVVVGATIRRLLNCFYHDILLSKILRRYDEKRELTRVRPNLARVLINLNGDFISTHQLPIEDINEEAFLIHSVEKINNPDLKKFKLQIVTNKRGNKRVRNATCSGHISQIRNNDNGYQYVVRYQPETSLNRYIV